MRCTWEMATDERACKRCHRSNLASPCCRMGLVRRSRRSCHLADGADLISALPDDLLLRVLSRLGCARAAASTSLLSHRWHPLWTHLPTLSFHDITPGQLEMALARVTCPAGAINISMPMHHKLLPAHISSLLSVIARLEPAKLDISMLMENADTANAIQLPSFDRTTSIDLDLNPFFTLLLPPTTAGDFTKLESISLGSCHVDLGALLSRCPRLRVLKIVWLLDSFKVHSSTLQELLVYARAELRAVDITAPLLSKCFFAACQGTSDEFSLSFSAPVPEDLTWRCKGLSRGWFGVQWRMQKLTFTTPVAQRRAFTSKWEDSQMQLANRRPRGNTLSLRIEIISHRHSTSSNVHRRFGQDISRIPVRSFSNLELDIKQGGHVCGPMVLDVLGLCTSIQKLKMILERYLARSTEMCSASCQCDQPNNWKNRSILLPNLKDLQVENFTGEDHEADLLKVILRNATVLERVNLYFCIDVSPESCSVHKELPSIILNAYSSVKFNIYRWNGDPILFQ